MKRSNNGRPALISEEEAEQYFLFIEKTMYRAVFFVVPLVVFLAIAAGSHLGVLGPPFITAVGLIVAVNAGAAINYSMRRDSLRAWSIFLLVSMPSITGAIAGLMFLDMAFGEPMRFSVDRFPEKMLVIGLGSIIFFVIGLIWAVYGNRRSIRQVELVAAFKQHVLTTAQASILLFFPQGRRPWGPAHFAVIGGIFVSILLTMRFNHVAVWYELVPIVVFTVLTSVTSLLLGMIIGVYMAVRPLFGRYGDVEIRRKST